MAVGNQATTAGPYLGTGSVDTYAYDFFIPSEDWLVVAETDDVTGDVTTLTLNVDYSVTGVGEASGGNVVLSSNLDTDHELFITMAPTIEQTTSFKTQGRYYPNLHESALDELTLICQYLLRKINNAIQLADQDNSDIDAILPTPAASQLIGWDAAGTALQNYTNSSALAEYLSAVNALSLSANQLVYATGSDSAAITSLTAFARTLLDDADASTARATLGLVVGTDVQAYSAILAATTASYTSANASQLADLVANALTAASIGVSVQGYDADTAKLDVVQSWTATQRALAAADNDGDFDMDTGQDWTWAPTGDDELTFDNITVGQHGCIKLDNASGHTITIDAAAVEAPADAASELSTAGVYIISYCVPHGETKALIEVSRALS